MLKPILMMINNHYTEVSSIQLEEGHIQFEIEVMYYNGILYQVRGNGCTHS